MADYKPTVGEAVSALISFHQSEVPSPVLIEECARQVDAAVKRAIRRHATPEGDR